MKQGVTEDLIVAYTTNDGVAATIENGFVHIPTAAHWLADYLHELTVFPNGRYDDQVDSTAQALAWGKMRPPGWGVLEYYRREAAKLKSASEGGEMVRMLAPTGIGALSTLSGRQITVPNDRIIEVSEEDAGPLRGGGFTDVDNSMEVAA